MSQNEIQKKRCKICNKKISLMSFNCKCDEIFCAIHRYPEEHNCPINYKEMGKDEINKANPIINSEKIKSF